MTDNYDPKVPTYLLWVESSLRCLTAITIVWSFKTTFWGQHVSKWESQVKNPNIYHPNNSHRIPNCGILPKPFVSDDSQMKPKRQELLFCLGATQTQPYCRNNFDYMIRANSSFHIHKRLSTNSKVSFKKQTINVMGTFNFEPVSLLTKQFLVKGKVAISML